jgi:cytochrome bd-type quinol oxidase subunit 1
MNYPVWDAPFLGGGLVIALIAIPHVFVSHFAVGGGFFLPLMETHALAHGRRDWLEVLKRHSRFFLLVTSVLGTVTGVGIWFAIGLASPPATSTLIHYWVLGWAMEWTVFLVELTTIAVYYATWGRVSDQVHVRLGWLYAVSSWLTLVIINGILTFMLTPTTAWVQAMAVGDRQITFQFWHAFFNPTYWPSLLVRTLVCVSLAGVYALITASQLDGQRQLDLKRGFVDYARRWLLPAFFLLPFGVAWYMAEVPEPHRALMLRGVSTASTGMFTMVTRMTLVSLVATVTTVLAAYLLTSRANVADFSLNGAIAIACVAFVAFGSFEHVREMLRKPHVIADFMYSNGVREFEAAHWNRDGYLTNSPWATPEEKARWAAAPDTPDPARGELMFRGQCMSCHTLDGYRAMRGLIAGRDAKSIASLLQLLHDRPDDSPYKTFMPQLVGTPGEIASLGSYLEILGQTGAAEGK